MKTITIEVDTTEGETPEMVLEEVLRQVQKGNTSGVYPHWEIKTN